MKVHIFQDELGLYTTSTVNRIISLGLNKQSLFINLSSKSTNHKDIIDLPTNWENVSDYLNQFKSIEKIYFHSYNYYSQAILNKVIFNSPNVESYWIFWSGEFYNLSHFAKNHYLKGSIKYFPERLLLRRLKNKFYHLKEKFYGRPYFNHSSFIKSFNQINYFCGILKSDFNNVVMYSNAKFVYKQFAYVPFDQYLLYKDIDCVDKIAKSKPLVMINHSGDPILNHFEVMDRIYHLKSKIDIVLPLVYGDKKFIEDFEMSYLIPDSGFNITILKNKMNPNEYMNYLSSIDVAIFNSTIQQGIGNILPLLWFGAKIFLRESNPVYKDLILWGFHIESIHDESFDEKVLLPLKSDEILENRKLLVKYFSEQAVNDYYKNIFS